MNLIINDTGNGFQVYRDKDGGCSAFCITVPTYEMATKLVIALLKSQACIGE